MAKIEAQAANAEDLARLKGAIDYDLAKAKGITGITAMKKADLIAALSK